jgi:7-cyano-7-deazaguanine synthase
LFENPNPSALVVLSGGIDSTTCLALAKKFYKFRPIIALSFDYGQRHSVQELRAAAKVADYFSVRHSVLHVRLPEGGLTDLSKPLPNSDYSELKGVSPTYVPYRNGTLLSNAAAYASASELGHIFWGAHAEDALNWAYPDCTPEFAGAMANAIFVGTYGKVRLITPLQWLGKKGVIEVGLELEAPYHLTRSCYSEHALSCGTCPTCRARLSAFNELGIKDPIPYADNPKEDPCA